MNTTPKTSSPTEAEVREAIALVRSLLEKTRQDRVTVEMSLEASALDGTPYAVAIIERGSELYLGEWRQIGTGEKVRGFAHFEMIPAGLCGMILSSLEGAAAKMEQLKASGKIAIVVHRRELERRQLEAYVRNGLTFEDTLRRLESKLGEIAPE